ncbi:hypothetical protein ACFL40_04170 [candidate division KSB1 bacterium]
MEKKHHILLISLFICLLLFFVFTLVNAAQFRSAKPVWIKGKEKEMNFSAGFRAVFDAPKDNKIILRTAGSSAYRIYINGEFSGYGPARGPHGFYRVDEWDITGKIKPGKNIAAVEAVGYNVDSYYFLDQPSFLQAEVLSENKILASTGGEGVRFEAVVLKERLQKVQRYALHMRVFSEVYRLYSGVDSWKNDADAYFDKAVYSVLPEIKLIDRGVPYPEFDRLPALWEVSRGKMERDVPVEKIKDLSTLFHIGNKFEGFPKEELEVIPFIELQKTKNITNTEIQKPYESKSRIVLENNTYHIFDFGTNFTGFIGAKIKCKSNTRFFFTFDELLTDGDVSITRLGCTNVVEYSMQAGTYEVETFEPYTLRYLKLIVFDGECEVENIYLRDYANPESYKAHFAASDERLNILFDAGRETFRQNAVDVFTDCPSRERAGWLCDSYFTARAGFNLCGNTTVEKNFFENYMLPEKFDYHPEGMLPMSYPAEHYDSRFIPNWAMFFVIQLEEYLERSGDREMADALKDKVLKLLKYFVKFENEDGLLEKLENWVFIEWSRASDFVQDVNYPTNMLYSAVLDAAGRMYNIPGLLTKAENIRKVIRKQSFDGKFFVDNALRKNGKLEVTRNRSEVCQYFAFYFGVADKEIQTELWNTLIEKFGPKRLETKAFPEIHPVNAFIGNVMRLEFLSRYGLGAQILNESIDYLMYMAERTGTLWEDIGDHDSCNHGFNSHICHTLIRDILGLYKIDVVNKMIKLRFSDLPLEWCEGIIPVSNGKIEIRWKKENGNIKYKLDIPAGYSVSVNNMSTYRLFRQP